MSGHSKWSKVKHQKATTDVVKARAFTKAARSVTIAVHEGGGIAEPNKNFKLRLAIEQARAVNMPKENIDRAIAKASGGSGGTTESFVYEAYGPAGSAFVIEAASEKRQRTVSFVKNVLERHGGTLAAQGAVLFQFEKIGLVSTALHPEKTEEELLSLVLETGARDMTVYDDSIEIQTSLADLQQVKESLEHRGISVNSAEMLYLPKQPLAIDESQKTLVDRITESLEELDDVIRVYTNTI